MASSESEPQPAPTEAEKPKIEPLRLPTPEEVRGQDIWNNCAVRSVVSGVLGLFPSLFFFSCKLKLWLFFEKMRSCCCLIEFIAHVFNGKI